MITLILVLILGVTSAAGFLLTSTPTTILANGGSIIILDFDNIDTSETGTAPLSDEFQSYGVVFASGTPLNITSPATVVTDGLWGNGAVSLPNSVAFGYQGNVVTATFVGPVSGNPAVTDFVSAQVGDKSGEPDPITMTAFDLNGNVLGSSSYTSSGIGDFGLVSISASGIHRVEFSDACPSGADFDDFTYRRVESASWQEEYLPDSYTVALLHMNECSGASSYDSSGNDNHGTIIEANWAVEGRFGCALSFDGVDDYILMPAGFGDIPQGTIEMWVQPNMDIDGPPGYQQFFFMKGCTSAHTGAHQFIIDSSGQLSYIKWDGGIGDTGWKVARSEGLTWKAGQWYHIAATWGLQGMHLYRDGCEVGSNSYTGTGVYNAFIAASIGNWSYQAGHQGYRGFYGTIDEFRLSSIQRTFTCDEAYPPGWDKGNKSGWEDSTPLGLDKKDKTPPGFDKGNKSGWD